MTAIKGVAVRPNAVMRRMRCLFFVVFYLKGEDIMDIAETTKIVVEKVADILVETPMGDLTVRPVHSEDYPGIEVFLRREDTDQDLVLALVECVRDKRTYRRNPTLLPVFTGRLWTQSTLLGSFMRVLRTFLRWRSQKTKVRRRCSLWPLRAMRTQLR